MSIGRKPRRVRDESSSDDDSAWEDDDDQELESSDAELQEAFASGKLKPGLNYAAPAKSVLANNKERLLQKLEDIKQALPWIERFDLTNSLAPIAPEIAAEIGIDPNIVLKNRKGSRKRKSSAEDVDVVDESEMLENVDDDFKRELRFYRQAQGAVLEAIPRLHALSIPTKRPTDYFAEMAKSDEQMKRIRAKLIGRQQSLELSEKAKKLREQRKYGKQVQQEVLKKRQEAKKKFTESVKKFRKGDKNVEDELEFMTELEGGANDRKQRHHPQKNGEQGPPRKSKKQGYKDSKYGFGGQKKRSKYNTKDSNNETDGVFDRRKHGSGPRSGAGKSKRPGKGVRQKMKNKNK